MIADYTYSEVLPYRMALYAPADQSPPTEGYYVDRHDILRMNLPPTKPSFGRAEAKQVLSGKTAAVDTLQKEFDRRVKQWEEQTSFHSSLGEIFTDESYQRIIGMGRDALPYIFSDLEHNPRHWFYALENIVGSDKAAGAKNFAEARAMWLKWGRDEYYI